MASIFKVVNCDRDNKGKAFATRKGIAPAFAILPINRPVQSHLQRFEVIQWSADETQGDILLTGLTLTSAMAFVRQRIAA